ncbi:MAG: hypothetical protein GF344_18000 [Chitinivibrionales bacterium]|nr:hypothetical protein [Chitinivibrionales bacterium]MBD3358550.1 hypothetical protein [Chitinivibrionales bacterium]
MMWNRSMRWVWGVALVCVYGAGAQYGQYSSRALLEKKIYYVKDGTIGQCAFWSLYLGDHESKVPMHVAGEGEVIVDANVNYNLMSSGYIEGHGYSSRGKVTTRGKFGVTEGDGVLPIPLDSIDYVSSYGRRVKPLGREDTTLILIAAGMNNLHIRRLLLRKFRYDKQYGELKPDGDIPIEAFSFTKKGAARALAAQKTKE